MNHPILVAALVEDRRRRCPCGAVAPSWTHAGTAKARLFARVPSLLQIIGKGTES